MIRWKVGRVESDAVAECAGEDDFGVGIGNGDVGLLW